MKIIEVIQHLETIAPTSLQEDYDNSGLLVGSPNQEVTGALLSLDCTEDIVEEAIANRCNLIISHHPIIFKGLKRLNGSNYVERTVIKAIRNDIAIYAIHTNLDNVFEQGVNSKICEKLQLGETQILQPKSKLLKKLVVFVPNKNAEKLRRALFQAGAGEIGAYSNCSFNLEGTGTFLAGENSNPHVGEKGKVHQEPEARVEVIVPHYLTRAVEKAMQANHPYEEVAHDWYALENKHQEIGSGMIGFLPKPMDAQDFLKFVAKQLNTDCIRYTSFKANRTIQKVAVCGGAGSFLLPVAKAQNADAFITGDFKYHEFFDSEGEIMVADVGHYESEQFTPELLSEVLREKFNTFAIRLSEVNTNPINYFH